MQSLYLSETVNIESVDIIINSLPIIKNSVKETWLLSLQFKIVQNTLATMKRLCDWRIRQTSKCDYCEHEDTIVHYIWECHSSQTIKTHCLKTLKLENKLTTKLNLVQFIFGFNNIRLDNLAMLIKNCIYQCKKTRKICNEHIFLKEVALRYLSDRSNLRIHVHNAKWEGLFIEMGNCNIFL